MSRSPLRASRLRIVNNHSLKHPRCFWMEIFPKDPNLCRARRAPNAQYCNLCLLIKTMFVSVSEFIIASPMEQFVIYPAFSLNFPLGPSLTNTTFYLQIAAAISITLAVAHKGEIVATWWGVQNESLYRSIQCIVEDYVGKNAAVYFPLLYTIFHIIFFSNQQGATPYSTTTTVEMVQTLSLSFTFIIGALQLGFFTHKHLLFASFLPGGTPVALIIPMVILETISTLTKVISLGLRQAINLSTGHIQVKTCIGFIWSAYQDGTSIFFQAQPIMFLSQFQAQELLIAYIQSWIFLFIICQTIHDFA